MHPDTKAALIDGLYALATDIWQNVEKYDPEVKAAVMNGFDWVRTKLAELESIPVSTPPAS